MEDSTDFILQVKAMHSSASSLLLKFTQLVVVEIHTKLTGKLITLGRNTSFIIGLALV